MLPIMNLDSFLHSLEQNGSSKPVTIHYRRPVATKKNYSGSPIFKSCVVNAFLDFNYQTSVNNQRKRENKPENFRSKRTWGRHTSRSIVTNGNKKYLHYKPQGVLETRYFCDDQEIAIEEIEPYLASSELPNPFEGANQDVTKVVRCRRLELSHITQINANKVEYSNE